MAAGSTRGERTLALAFATRRNTAGVASFKTRHTVGGDATGPSRGGLIVQRVDVGDRLRVVRLLLRPLATLHIPGF